MYIRPSNYPQRVIDALGKQVMGHLHKETCEIMDDIKEGIQYIFQTKNEITMCVSASGHGGMDATMCNLLEENDVALFGATGHWGHRAADMAKRYGADVRILESELGKALSVDEIKSAIELHKPVIFFLAHCDSSTGVVQSYLGDIGLICRKHNVIFIVDTVASLGGIDFLMDEWKIDVAYTGSQKCLGAPPGITPISLNDRAMFKITSRKSPVKVYYWDFILIATYWKCFPSEQRIYHHTISVTLLYGLREALAIMAEEGLQSSIRRHTSCSFKLQQGVEKMGLEMFVKLPFHRASTVNAIKVPEGVDWTKVSDYAMNKYKLEISGGLGPTKGKVWRIGLLGLNASSEKVDLVLKILKESIENTSDFIFVDKSKM
ncbi:alanine--glyoxylate aminotransferase-like isoform X2 [Condylostylus longicornis]|uniref:alanine--glyoxylate aminotransferase-like isoform X2 n=1 Tax=Condylostylus longicornis TaxID=2530218 RepID=UPI00244DD4F1|nr:alanine--glyoxylate aminotransferase-like isoform X2 [Condylostylus longicornis]